MRGSVWHCVAACMLRWLPCHAFELLLTLHVQGCCAPCLSTTHTMYTWIYICSVPQMSPIITTSFSANMSYEYDSLCAHWLLFKIHFKIWLCVLPSLSASDTLFLQRCPIVAVSLAANGQCNKNSLSANEPYKTYFPKMSFIIDGSILYMDIYI